MHFSIFYWHRDNHFNCSGDTLILIGSKSNINVE